MRIRYFPGTDTLWIELREAPIAETRDLDDVTLVDVDDSGAICSITSSMLRKGPTCRAYRTNR